MSQYIWQMASNSKLQNELLELNVDATSSHVKVYAILSDHIFDSKSMIEIF